MPRGAARGAALALTVIVALTGSGCGVAQTGSVDRVRQLFTSKCATCHSLKDAGSTAQIGPDLDAAFAQARASGMDPDTIAGVVKAQVDNPRPSTSNPSTSMPPHLVSGEDLNDVATYVASVAGAPGITGPQLPHDPRAPVVASNRCSRRHVLKAAGAPRPTRPGLRPGVPGMNAARGE